VTDAVMDVATFVIVVVIIPAMALAAWRAVVVATDRWWRRHEQ